MCPTFDFKNGGVTFVCKYHTWPWGMYPPTPYGLVMRRKRMKVNLGYSPLKI